MMRVEFCVLEHPPPLFGIIQKYIKSVNTPQKVKSIKLALKNSACLQNVCRILK